MAGHRALDVELIPHLQPALIQSKSAGTLFQCGHFARSSQGIDIKDYL
jgi:hypothetical protein